MNTHYTCHVFLADDQVHKEILSVFCKTTDEPRAAAQQKVQDILQKHKQHSYVVRYVGDIHFEDIDPDIVARQDELFEKHDSVWILNCSYNPHF
ncbi:hypothetical protein GCM10011391_05540 [Pullulanibacillus camelliae]|uniref:Uncharacterized protein n=1 Tax=Pullulanibacillus camelliae TaxID=1707096 RepID=A0A8J2VFR1_9BACL|nr:hypothetical protein [Pullulanibacillus camelliae]GGE29888.1 hypothetical protein GCM10011391_05540 [Pullulanibacillus camelliae]